MTVIAAVIGDGYVALAADSYAFSGGRRFSYPRKLFPLGHVSGDAVGVPVVGFCGECSFGELVRHEIEAPRLPNSSDEDACDEWAHDVAVAVHEAARAAKLGDSPGSFLLALDGRCWELDDRSAFPIFDRFTAIGAGAPVATGALDVLVDVGDPATAARRAVEATCRWSTHCHGPVTTIDTMGGR